MAADDLTVTAIAALSEPVRRELYRYVVAQDRPVGRGDAAGALGIARHVAKFHLENLVANGLLDVEFRRPPGRRGPGAGRPAKLYRRSALEFSVHLPERRYDLGGRILAQAITDTTMGELSVLEAVDRAATAVGTALGQEARSRLGTQRGRSATLALAREVLDEHGFEPRAVGHGLILKNCPFRDLAAEFPDVVCRMNLALVRGLVTGLGQTTMAAHLDPAGDRCCVLLGTSR